MLDVASLERTVDDDQEKALLRASDVLWESHQDTYPRTAE